MSKRRGDGTVYLRGKTWWLKYYDHGHPIQESSHSEDRATAEALLRERVEDLRAGRDVTPEKCTVGDLCRLVIADYRLRKLKDAKIVEWRYKANVAPELGKLKAAKLNTSIVRRYVETRRKQKAEDATINRELAIIRRGYRLGKDEDPPLVRRMPRIPKLEEDNARQGFVEPEQYEKILEHLPARMKALFVCAYHVGSRKGELRKLRIDQVDLEAGLIRVEKGQTKGRKPRTLPIYGDMGRWIRQQIETAGAAPWLFHNGKGRRIGSALVGWREACEAAGVPGLLFHDLRRSAVRNMKRAGVQDKVAMEISGHRTRAIFDRYNIVDEGDLGAAGEKMAEYFAERKRARAAKLKRVK